MNRYLSFAFVLSISASLISCEKKTDNANHKSTDSIVKKEPAKEATYYPGEADKPINEFQVTSAGLGKLILGDSLEKVLKILEPVTKKVRDEVYFEEGKEWPSKKIFLTNGYFIKISMVNTIDLVTTIHTNDPSFLTKSGIHVGQFVDSLNYPLDSIKSDFDHKAFTVGNDGVWFKIDNKEEKKYFKSDNPKPELLRDAKIEELFVVCGDC